MTDMDFKLKINLKDAERTQHDWYVAKWESTEYNRVLYVRDSNTVFVFSDDCDMVQQYTMGEAERLYKDWKEATVKMEAN